MSDVRDVRQLLYSKSIENRLSQFQTFSHKAYFIYTRKITSVQNE